MRVMKICLLVSMTVSSCLSAVYPDTAVAIEAADSIAGISLKNTETAKSSMRLINQTAVHTTNTGNCGSKGCSPFKVNYLSFSRATSVPDQSQVLLVSAANTSDTGITDAVIDLEVHGGTFVKAPGCTLLSPSRVECRQQIVDGSASVARTVLVTPKAAWTVIHVGARSYSSEQPFAPDAVATAWNYITSTALRMRLTSVDASACPLVKATVNTTDVLGQTYVFPAWYSFAEDDHPVAAIETSTNTMQRSIAFLLDNSKGVSQNHWVYMLEAISSSVHEWSSWAESANSPMPEFVVYSMAPALRRLALSSDPNAIDAALASIRQESSATYTFDALDSAADDLMTRSGQRAVVIMSSGLDAKGSVQRDDVVARLSRGNINVYGLVLNRIAEPLLFDLAQATAGLSIYNEFQFDFGYYLTQFAIDLRSTRQFEWQTPFTQPSYRIVDAYSSEPLISPYVYRDYTPANSECADTCLVTRIAPHNATKRRDATIILNIAKSPDSSPITIAESIPNGWIVTDVDSGGIWNPSTNKISWHVAAGDTSRALSYTIRNQSSHATFLRFVGTSEMADQTSRICGNTFAEVLPISPGGLAHEFGATQQAGSMAEAFAIAWKEGSPWHGKGTQIPVSHVTRVLQIQSYGGEYDTIEAPLPWIAHGEVAPVGERSSARELPIDYGVGASFQVQLAINPGTTSSAHAVEELPPAGWTVSAISSDGVFDADSRMIRWGAFKDDLPRVLRYTLTPPVDASGVVVFSGRLSVDGIDTEIEGSRVLNSDRIFANDFD